MTILVLRGDNPATMSAMRRALALRIKADMAGNWRIIQRPQVALEIALLCLLLDMLAWLFGNRWRLSKVFWSDRGVVLDRPPA